MNPTLPLTPSGVRNMLSFLATLEIFPLVVKSCHLLFPASSSRVALTLRGTLGGLTGPSLTLLGSRLAWSAKAGLMFAAAEITLRFAEDAGVVGVGGGPSALRFFESFKAGFRSLAERLSVVV